MNHEMFVFAPYRRLLDWRLNTREAPPDHDVPAEQRLRVGVVGGGDIGLRNANSVKNAPAAGVAAVCDVNPETLRDLARRFEAPAFEDYDAMLDQAEIDAVILSLPHMLHAPFALKAAAAGKHVLLEKPLGVNLHDATEIVQACQQHDVRLTVNFSYRYRPVVQLTHQLIQEGMLGDICSTQITFLQFKGASYWAGGFTARAPGDWRASKAQAGGGVYMITICHMLDYLRYCTGLEVTRAFSEHGVFASPVEVEDSIMVALQYDNGGVGGVAGSSCWRAEMVDEVRIWGTHGALTIRQNCGELSFWSAKRWRGLGAGQEYLFKDFPSPDYTSTWINQFALAIAKDTPHDITGQDGWINNAVIEASYQSRDLGQPVVVPSYLQEEKV